MWTHLATSGSGFSSGSLCYQPQVLLPGFCSEDISLDREPLSSKTSRQDQRWVWHSQNYVSAHCGRMAKFLGDWLGATRQTKGRERSQGRVITQHPPVPPIYVGGARASRIKVEQCAWWMAWKHRQFGASTSEGWGREWGVPSLGCRGRTLAIPSFQKILWCWSSDI